MDFQMTTYETGTASDRIRRLPFNRNTRIDDASGPAAVILVPDDDAYRHLGHRLSDAVFERTGVRLDVADASEYALCNPRAVRPEKLDRHFVLLGQFWNNAVLERLYCRYFDPTDAFFPGPGGWELRTVVAPFRHDHNCVVVTGSDLDGCRKAVEHLPGRIVEGALPFLLEVHLTGEAAEYEARYKETMTPVFAELDKYTVYGHPEGKSWYGQRGDARHEVAFSTSNLVMAGCVGLRYWATGHRPSGEAAKTMLLAAVRDRERLERAYAEGAATLMDYGGPSFTIAWDIIEATDLFSDSERSEIDEYMHFHARTSRDAYFAMHCKDTPMDEIVLGGRHQVSGTFWLGIYGEWLKRGFEVDDEQRQFADDLQAHALVFARRMGQSYLYTGVPMFIRDETQLMLRYSLMIGETGFIENGTLAQIADYYVYTNGNANRYSEGRETLNAAGWLLPGNGYRWYSSTRVARTGTTEFFFFVTDDCYIRLYGNDFQPLPYYHWETPATDDGSEALKARMSGLSILPVPKPLLDFMKSRPADDYHLTSYGKNYPTELMESEGVWKCIAFRTGLDSSDQFLLLNGIFGVCGDPTVQAVEACEDRGRQWLKLRADAQMVDSRMDLSTLFVSDGSAGGPQSACSRLVGAADLGPFALLGTRLSHHDGVAWTRRVFWQKGGWFLIADEIDALDAGDFIIARSWHSDLVFELGEKLAIANAGDATFSILGTGATSLQPADVGIDIPEERQFWSKALCEMRSNLGEDTGVRECAEVSLEPGEPRVFWSLLHAASPNENREYSLNQVSERAVLLREGKSGSTTMAFVGVCEGPGIRIEAEMGLLSSDRATLLGCRILEVDGESLLADTAGVSVGWDLSGNTFEAGKSGYGLSPGAMPRGLESRCESVKRAIGRLLDATPIPKTDASAGRKPAGVSLPMLASESITLQTPVRLSSGDLQGNGNDELLLYDANGSHRFEGIPPLRVPPIAVDFDGNGRRDIVVAYGRSVIAYRRDGGVRWKANVGPIRLSYTPDTGNSQIGATGAGDFDGDGREEVGVGMLNRVVVLDSAGSQIVDQAIQTYKATAVAFGDVDGDGANEIVVPGAIFLAVASPHAPLRLVSPPHPGWAPCRLWLHRPEGAERPLIYVGGGMTDLACIDGKTMQVVWGFTDTATHQRDVAMLVGGPYINPVFVAATGDGFVHVVDEHGKLVTRKRIGAGIRVLEVANLDGGQFLVAGLDDGRVIVTDARLDPVGEVRVSRKPIAHMAVLRRAGSTPVVVASDDTGHAARITM